MGFSSWRGTVGLVNPTMRPGPTEELIRLLPEGIGVIPLFLDIRAGTHDEFKTAMPAYEEKVALLAEQRMRSDPPDRRAALHGAGAQGGDAHRRRVGEEIPDHDLHQWPKTMWQRSRH